MVVTINMISIIPATYIAGVFLLKYQILFHVIDNFFHEVRNTFQFIVMIKIGLVFIVRNLCIFNKLLPILFPGTLAPLQMNKQSLVDMKMFFFM
jgi:hypothetical protein